MTRIGSREKKVMTGAVNRIPGRFKIWSVLSLAPSGPAFALSKCFLRRSWEERGERGELLVRVRTLAMAREWGHTAGLAWPWADLASPGPHTPGWTPLSPRGQGEINRCDEANLYKIMLITRVIKSSEGENGKWTNVGWYTISVFYNLRFCAIMQTGSVNTFSI